MAEIKQPVQSTEQPVYQQPQGQQKPSYSAVTGTEEWSHDIFGCLDGGLESNDNLCTSFSISLSGSELIRNEQA